MARKKYTEVERNLMKGISRSVKKILKEKKLTQKDLALKTNLSESVISDYMREKTLASPGVVQTMADALGVPMSAIDPSLPKPESEEENKKMKFFEELESELGIDLSDPLVQKALKRAAKIAFADED